MSEWVIETIEAPDPPAVDHIVTEDDTPVDNIFSAKLQRLLVQSLYLSYHPETTFLADANVGIFRTPQLPPIVPDVFLSLDVTLAENWYAKEHRTYFVWQFGKAPDVVIEIVSNNKGGENNRKLREYARLSIWYYAIYDPQRLIQDEPLIVYELTSTGYQIKENSFLDRVGLGLTVWHGPFEGKDGDWLRWYGEDGELLLTGEEQVAQEQQRVDQERERADEAWQRVEQEWQRAEQEQLRAEQERQRAEQEKERAERLMAQLRALGIEPDL